MSWLSAKHLLCHHWMKSFLIILGIVGTLIAGTLINQRSYYSSSKGIAIRPCPDKQRQSPIELQTTIQVDLTPLQYDYHSVPLTVVHNGNTIQVNYRSGSTLTLDEQLYTLEEVHFQAPSEHIVAGMPYAMEVQLVHRYGEHVVIVGIFVEVGEDNPVMQSIWEHMPATPGLKKTFDNVAIDAAQLLPDNLGAYYRYSGSWTEPPYSESVTWIIMRDPITLSITQLEQFITVLGETARPVQPRHNRLILEAI
ncbi:carbonic anhydrase [Leptolyngbya sp. PCC 7375]|nr:carbonic anhydrase [Leptolyngbya sp. PCC 7375]